jgi:hypothetical protein
MTQLADLGARVSVESAARALEPHLCAALFGAG